MKSSYPKSIAFVLQQEGGYSNHPKDPGGPTNFGITIADVRKYYKANATAADVKALPKPVAEMIYEKHYWAPVRGDDLPAGLDVCTFDSAVNSGVGRANLWLGYAIGSKAKDYPTLAKDASVVKDIPKSVKSFCAKRLSFLQSLKTWSTFKGGWSKRVSALQALALSLAYQATQTPSQAVASLKADAAEIRKDTQSTVAMGTPAAGAGTGGAAVSWQWDIPHTLIVIGVVAVVVFVAYSFIHGSNQARALDDEIAKLSKEAGLDADT